MAKPRGLRASSGYSRPRVTVENRTKTGVFSPTVDRKFAFYHRQIAFTSGLELTELTVRLVTSFVHSK